MKGLKVKGSLMALMLWANALCAEDKGASMTLDDIKNSLGLSVYLQGGYTYNLRNPDSQENDFRVFDHKANSFTLDLAQISITKEPEPKKVGFKFKLSIGETAKFIHSAGLGKEDEAVDLTEAYLSYVAPFGNGLRFDFGKFVTFLGAEVIEAMDNPNYSRSFLFNYAIAFTHTGLKISYPFSNALNTALYIVNGWDNTRDNNKAKTVGLSVGYAPVEQMAMTFNFIYGPEQDDNNSNNRFLFDWIGTFKPVKALTFILNADYGSEEKATPDRKKAKWYGIAGIAKYDFNEAFSLSLRVESFKDDKGVRTGTPQTLKEITLTPELRVAKNFLIRPEYRHDWSNKKTFDTERKKYQDTLALGVMYKW